MCIRDRDKKEGDRKVAVYDLGGGTFDVSIIEIADLDGDQQSKCYQLTVIPSLVVKTSIMH